MGDEEGRNLFVEIRRGTTSRGGEEGPTTTSELGTGSATAFPYYIIIVIGNYYFSNANP